MVEALLKNNNTIDPLTRKRFRNDAIFINNSVKQATIWYSNKYPEIVFRSDNREIEI